MNLFLDMDGVVADFNDALMRRGIIPRDDYWMARHRDQWTQEEIDHDNRVGEAMDDDSFWLGIRPYHGAREFYDAAMRIWPTKVVFLTALPKKPERAGPIRLIKKLWLYEHLGVVPRDVIVCRRSEKGHYARAGGLLVDDLLTNCEEFRKAGGEAILHKNFTDTVKQLKELQNV